MSEQQWKYDVAISFLSKDEPIAIELHRHLIDGLEVFIYSKKQEEIAGTDGLESFRQAFRRDSRVVVVLFREGWGQTPWTRVEEGAITDRFLSEGWRWLFFIVVDKKSPLPKWLPENHIRFNLEDYGVEQAVGAIKARVQELGGRLQKLDAIGRAKILQKDSEFRDQKRQLFTSPQGVNAVQSEVISMYKEIERLRFEITSTTDIIFQMGHTVRECILTNGRVSLHLSWAPRYANNMENSPLRIYEVNGRMLLPQEKGAKCSGQNPLAYKKLNSIQK